MSNLRVNSIIPSLGTNVAIGTAGGTITYNATVSGVSTFSNGIVVSAGTTSAPSISPSGDSNTGIFFPSADTVAIGEGGTEALRVDSSGRLGIGTNNPSRPLHINGSGNLGTQVQINSTLDSAGITLFPLSGNNYEIQATASSAAEPNSFIVFDRTNTLYRLIIDSAGRVKMPYQPMFSAYGTSTQSISANAGQAVKVTIWGGENFDNANNFGSSTFTAPVAGKYLFGTNLRVDNVSSTYWRVIISKNGGTDLSTNGHSITRYEVNGAGSYHTMAVTAFFSLAANDYVEVYILSDSDTSYNAQSESQFWGYLVG